VRRVPAGNDRDYADAYHANGGSLKILVLAEDLFARNGAPAAFFRLAMRRHPAIRFLWPSRSEDLRASARGCFPANATPFAVDRSPELRRIAAAFVEDPAEMALALEVAAAAAALQGLVFDAVDVPSLSPAAHLVRPIFGAMGVGVGRVVESWMGSPADCRRHAWPEPGMPDQQGCQAAMEARSAAAAELRYGILAYAPPRGGDPSVTLPMTALFAPPPPLRELDGTGATNLYFRGRPDGEGGIDRFLRLAANLPRSRPLRCVLPPEGDRPAALRAVITTEAKRLGIDLEFGPVPEQVLACGAAPSPAPILDPAPLEALLRGEPVALSDCSWTAAALDAEGAGELAPFRLDLGRPDSELAATLGDMLGRADAAAAALRAALAVRHWSSPSITLESIYGVRPARRRLPGYRIELPLVLVAAALHPAQPRRGATQAPDVAAVVVASGEPVAALAGTLSSLARQEVGSMEVIVVDDGSSDPVGLRDAAEAAGGCVRLIRQGEAGTASAMNRGLGEAVAPFVCFLSAGILGTTDLLAAALAAFVASGEPGAVIPSWTDLEVAAESDADLAAPLTGPDGGIRGAASRGPAFLLRRSAAVKAGGFDSTVGPWAPLDLMLRLEAQGDRVIALGGPARVFKAWPAFPRAANQRRDEALLRVLSKRSGRAAAPRGGASIGA
jgi:hypothetical protein